MRWALLFPALTQFRFLLCAILSLKSSNDYLPVFQLISKHAKSNFILFPVAASVSRASLLCYGSWIMWLFPMRRSNHLHNVNLCCRCVNSNLFLGCTRFRARYLLLFFDLENWSVVTFKMLQHQKRKKCENLYIAVFFFLCLSVVLTDSFS